MLRICPEMAGDMMNLRSLVEKSADADLLGEMIGFAAEKLMALEVGTATGAGYGAKTALRLTKQPGKIGNLNLAFRRGRLSSTAGSGVNINGAMPSVSSKRPKRRSR